MFVLLETRRLSRLKIRHQDLSIIETNVQISVCSEGQAGESIGFPFSQRDLPRRGDPPFFLEECHCLQEQRVTSPALWAWKPTTEGALPAHAFPAASPTASALQAPFFCTSLGGGAPWPRGSLRTTPGQLPDWRRLPSERVRGQQSAGVPSARPGQPSSGGTKARTTLPGHHSFAHWSPQLCRQALPSVRPSVLPDISPVFP